MIQNNGSNLFLVPSPRLGIYAKSGCLVAFSTSDDIRSALQQYAADTSQDGWKYTALLEVETEEDFEAQGEATVLSFKVLNG